jgi:hypothetical protein
MRGWVFALSLTRMPIRVGNGEGDICLGIIAELELEAGIGLTAKGLGFGSPVVVVLGFGVWLMASWMVGIIFLCWFD